MKKTKKYEGFTIIEVVLVLAIAGLIFLMVFIAWPALQRSQHDTQRRNDMARFITQLDSYKTNNGGKVPTASTSGYSTFITNYLTVNNDKFNDPTTGKTYTVGSFTKCTDSKCAQASLAEDAGKGIIRVYSNARCDGENPKYVAGDNNIVVTIKLEGAGIYCGQN